MRAVEPPPKGAEERPSVVEEVDIPFPPSIIHGFTDFATGNFKRTGGNFIGHYLLYRPGH